MRPTQLLDITAGLARHLRAKGSAALDAPNGTRALERLHGDLERHLALVPELSLIIFPPSTPDGRPEIFVDGGSPARANLRRLLPSDKTGAVAAQLLEVLSDKGVAAVSFRTGLTLPELETFVRFVVSPRRAFEIHKALLANQVTTIVLLSDGEVTALDDSWAVSVAVARLVHDVRALVPKLAAPARSEIPVEILLGALRPLLADGSALLALISHADAIEHALWRRADLAHVRARPLIVRALPDSAVDVLAAAADPKALAGWTADARHQLLTAVGERLLSQPPSGPRNRELRRLVAGGYVPLDNLPDDLRVEVAAQRWVDAYDGAPGAPVPSARAELVSAARIALGAARWNAARAAMEALAVRAPEARAGLVDGMTLASLIDAIHDEPAGVASALDLLASPQMLSDAARAIGELDAARATSAGRLLASAGPNGIAAARVALAGGVASEAGATTLLALLRLDPNRDDASTIARYLQHPEDGVRRAALPVLAACHPDAATAAIVRSFGDADPSVRARAMSLASTTGIGRPQLLQHALRLLTDGAAVAAPPIVVVAAAELVARAPLQGVLPRAQAEEVLCELVAPVGLVGRLMGRKRVALEVVVAALAGLAALGGPRAKKALELSTRDADPEVAAAARDAAAAPRSLTPAAELPAVVAPAGPASARPPPSSRPDSSRPPSHAPASVRPAPRASAPPLPRTDADD